MESRREPSANDSFKEIMQTGLECFGEIGVKEVAEVVTLAVKSLKTISEECVLDLSDLNVTDAFLTKIGASYADRKAIAEAAESKNADRIQTLLKEAGADEEALKVAAVLYGVADNLGVAIEKLQNIEYYFGEGSALEEFISVLKLLRAEEEGASVRVDFSVVGDANYYNGIKRAPI